MQIQYPDLPNFVRLHFQETYLREISPLFAALGVLFPKLGTQSISFTGGQPAGHVSPYVRQEPHTCYKDDGVTKCKGSEYTLFFHVPLWRLGSDIWQEWRSYESGTAQSSLFIVAQCHVREYDERLKGDYGCVTIAPLNAPIGSKSNDRICYSNHGGIGLNHAHDFGRIVALLQQIERDAETFQRASELWDSAWWKVANGRQ